MASLKKSNRLAPPLMWAFRSAHESRDARRQVDLGTDGGERILASPKSKAAASITEPVLRREVARDLEALLNTIALESSIDLSGHDHVRRSILNYGFPDLNHRTIDEVSAINDIKGEIETVIRRYEPRLIPETIQVERDLSVKTAELKIRFVVHADLACKPRDVPVEFTAEIETDSGKIVINRF